MGFEQFKRSDGNREDKVMALAKLLHQRGLTSSMSSAKRLAEGMVEVEKKIIKAPNVLPEPSASLHEEKLPGEFLHFIEQAARIPQEEVAPTVTITERKKEMQTPTPMTAPVSSAKQVWFDDAPDMSKARGFTGQKFQTPEFHSQKVLARQEQEAKQAAQEIESTPVQPVETTPVEQVTSEPTPETTPVEQTATTPTIAEKIIDAMQDEEASEFIAPAESETQPIEPTESVPDTTIIESAQQCQEAPAEPIPTEPVQGVPSPQSTPTAAPEKVDLAKQHGVDLFEMFKKK